VGGGGGVGGVVGRKEGGWAGKRGRVRERERGGKVGVGGCMQGGSGYGARKNKGGRGEEGLGV